MSTEDASRPLPIQYLGVPGSTNECVHAMVTILTSPYPCQEITIVVEHVDGEDHEAVCFVVWGWLGQDVTIVPDGFGTHGGTGGWGLGLVLELMEFYRVTIKERWVEPDMFERIASGQPTRSDLATLQQTDMTAPSWPYWKRLFTRPQRTRAAFDDAWAEQFPFWLLEPEILDEVRDVKQDPATAVFRAVKRLEIIIRAIGSFSADTVGRRLVNDAFGEHGKLPLQGAVPDESQAWANLFRGVFGAFKNPQSHRDGKLTVEDAAGQILAVNTLLRKLKTDYPDQFTQQTPDDGEDEYS